MNKAIITKTVTFAAVIGGALIGQWATSDLFTQSPEDKTKLLMQAASEINANLPMNVDAETILLTTVGVQNKFTYKYKLPNYEKENLDIAAFEQSMTPNITNAVCSTEDMKAFRDMEIVVSYSYFDANQKQITEIMVDTKKCLKS